MAQIIETSEPMAKELARKGDELLQQCHTKGDLLTLASTAFEIGRSVSVSLMGPRAAAKWLRQIADLMDASTH